MKNEWLGIVAVLGVTCLTASASPATPVPSAAVTEAAVSTLPPSACFADYLESKDNFYATVNGGAIFFDGPIKDQSNIYMGGGGGALNVTNHPLGSSSTSDTTGSIGGSFGYVFDRHPREDWLGSNVRAEVGGDYFQTCASSSLNVNTQPTNYLAVGRLDGQNFTDSGSLVRNPLISIGSSPISPIGNISFDSHDDIYDAQVVVKSDYHLAQGAFVFTPEVGLGFARIEQRSSTDLSGFTNAPAFANEQENINANYYGAILGFQLKANVTKQFVPFFSTITTLGYAQSDYFGAQEYNSNFNTDSQNGNDSVSASDGNFFARVQVSGGFYYDFGPVILKVAGGVDYWSDVPTVQEATVATGTPVANLNFNVPAAHLVATSIANPEANVTVIVPF